MSEKSKLVRVYPEDAEYLEKLKGSPRVLEGLGVKHLRRTVALALSYLIRFHREHGKSSTRG